MSLRALWVSGVLFAVLLLAACQQSPTGGIVIQQEPSGPRLVVVNGSPIAAPPEPGPADESVPVLVPENVLPRDEPEVIVIPESKPAEDPVQACLDKCEASCKTSARLACSKPTGVECKANCGSIIDPSACSTACSLRNANACEPKFVEYCSSMCVERCY